MPKPVSWQQTGNPGEGEAFRQAVMGPPDISREERGQEMVTRAAPCHRSANLRGHGVPHGPACAGRDEHGVGDTRAGCGDTSSGLNGLCILETEDLASPGTPQGTDVFL